MIFFFFFFFNDTATPEIYTVYNTLSLHDALPISPDASSSTCRARSCTTPTRTQSRARSEEHTSELQSLYTTSYAVVCLSKKNRQSLMSSDLGPQQVADSHGRLRNC